MGTFYFGIIIWVLLILAEYKVPSKHLFVIQKLRLIGLLPSVFHKIPYMIFKIQYWTPIRAECTCIENLDVNHSEGCSLSSSTGVLGLGCTGSSGIFVTMAKTCNPLPDDKILDWSKLKQIADDILNCI